jgi:hypothetical protein
MINVVDNLELSRWYCSRYLCVVVCVHDILICTYHNVYIGGSISQPSLNEIQIM